MNKTSFERALAAASLGLLSLLAGCERPPVDSVQRGFRGTGMEQVYNPRTVQAQAPQNALPPDTPPASDAGPKAGQVFQNVRVLNDLSVGEFTRLMVSMTAWVSPAQGCTYCHAGNNMASDDLYTKVVARRMLQMTQHINADWKTHVADTGVTCYTCHRGQPVPANVWTQAPTQPQRSDTLGNKAGQNMPAASVAMASLPYDPFTPFLSQASNIRVIGTTALPTGNRQSTKQTEWTYGLMMHMSESLGVNCTYCHNTRSFGDWETSSPPRGTAWYGIRMARDLNAQYLDPLASVFPATRLGSQGDAPKVNCATCHQGAYKPLYGASMLSNHPELGKVRTVASNSGAAAAATMPSAAAAQPAAENAAQPAAAVAPAQQPAATEAPAQAPAAESATQPAAGAGAKP